jgi:hypothetical protein
MIRSLSEMVIIPIAGIIMTFVLSYELINMLLEKNNMAEFDLANIYGVLQIQLTKTKK